MSKLTAKTAQTARKSGIMPRANTPEPDIETLKDEAKQLLKNTKLSLDQSGNIKTTIKETVLTNLHALYEIVEKLNESRLAVKHNLEIVLARKTVTIDKPKYLDDINENMEKILEEVKAQKTISEKTQNDLNDLKREIQLKEMTPQQSATIIDNPSVTPTKTYAEALVEPRPKTTHCIIIGTDNVIDTSEDVITKIKDKINAQESGLQISKLRKVKDQRVLIGCEKKSDIDLIKETLEKNDFKVEIKENKDPLVIVRNLDKSITDNGILQAIEKQNPELLDHIPMEHFRMKVRHRRKARNPAENHVVLQVSPPVWRALTSAGRLYVEFQRVPVYDLSPLVQCSRCLSFGHGKKWCTETIDLCSHCAGPHMSTDCPSLLAGDEPMCRNCQQAKCPRTDHNAFDTRCPVRKKWDALARSSVAYN